MKLRKSRSSGEYRFKATLEQLPLASDYAPGSNDWATVRQLYVSIEPKAASEPVDAEQKQGVNEFVIRTPYTANDPPEPHMRITYGGEAYEIKTVTNVNHQFTEHEIIATVMP